MCSASAIFISPCKSKMMSGFCTNETPSTSVAYRSAAALRASFVPIKRKLDIRHSIPFHKRYTDLPVSIPNLKTTRNKSPFHPFLERVGCYKISFRARHLPNPPNFWITTTFICYTSIVMVQMYIYTLP
jgi:hypothetical protein